MILAELRSEPLKSAEGLNKVVDKIGGRIESMISGKRLFLLVLDEYDSIFSDTRGKPSDFIYKLLTMEENLREKGILVCIVTISNNALNDYQLDDRVKSRIGSSEVFFSPYSKDDLVGILRDRANKAFAIKVKDDVIEYCATLGSSDHGDARRGLDLLRLAGELCDGKTVTKFDVDKAQEQLQKDRVAVIVSNAPYHQRTLIAAICVKTLYSETGWIATSEIYEKYTKIISKDLKALLYRRMVDLLVEVENSGLVTSRTLSRGRGGYGTEYRMKVSPDIVGPAVDREWWEIQIREKARKDELEELVDSLEKNRNLFSFGGRKRYALPSLNSLKLGKL
jgi:cell division control protein 6